MLSYLFNFKFNKDFLTELYSLEKNLMEKTSKDTLIFYFYNLLNNLNRNQMDFEKVYSDFNSKNLHFSQDLNQDGNKVSSNEFIKETKKLIQLN